MIDCIHLRVVWAGLTSLVLVGCATVAPSKKDAGAASAAAVSAEERRIQAHAHFAAGLSYDLNQKPDDALREFHQAALADPGYDPIVLETARRYLRAKENAKALEVLQKAAALRNSSGAIHAWLGLAYVQAGRTNDAISANETAIKKMPDALVAYQNLAQLYLQKGETNRALKILDQAGRQSAAEPAFFIDLSELYLRFGRTQTNKAEYAKERARSALERAHKLKSENPFVQQKLAEGFLALGELARAAEVYAEMVAANPGIPALRAKLAEIYLRLGENDKASKELEAIASADPTNPQTHFFLGALALEQKQPEKAVEAFERAILLRPDLEIAYYELASAQLSLEKGRDAWATLEKARRRFKPNFILEFYSGLVQSALKDYPEALKHFASAELLAQANEPARLTHRFYFQLGATYERAGEHAESEKHFRKSIELEPDFADALNYLGYMWAEKGTNLVEARQMIERAVKLEPENAAYLDSLAWVFYKLKQPAEALPWQLKAMQHSETPDATLLDHLGDIYAELNQMDRARDAWEKSLKIEPNEKIQQKLDAARRSVP